MADAKNVTWLTQEAHDRLTAELEHLSGAGRNDIAKRIEAARDEGDLKENGGYHAAREEQGKQEARIQRLRYLLDNAVVGEATDSSVISSGTVVKAEVAGREMKFLVGSREVAGDTDLNVFSAQSPLGEALMGKSAGDETSYAAPNGNQISVKVISVELFES